MDSDTSNDVEGVHQRFCIDNEGSSVITFATLIQVANNQSDICAMNGVLSVPSMHIL